MSESLHVRIERRIRQISATDGSYISVAPSDLSSFLSNELLERIATEAAKEAQEYYHEQTIQFAEVLRRIERNAKLIGGNPFQDGEIAATALRE